ncbi:phenylacetaldoxime dehydratase [Botrytis cinerea]
MVFLVDMDEKDYVFTYGIFGVQHEEFTPEKAVFVSTLYKLLSSSANRVDHLQDESHGLPRHSPKSTTFIAYWLLLSSSRILELSPPDAGVWREVMTVPKSRFMFASSQPVASAMGTLLPLKQSSDEGYWGVYRHRLSETPDSHTDPKDTFTSAYITPTKAKPNDTRKTIEIPNTRSSKMKLGRVTISSPPDNLVFVREGQRQPNVPPAETEAWLKKINPHAQSWISHLDTERNKNGVVAFTTHISHENPTPEILNEKFDGEADLELDTEAIAETNQLAYFLDLSHFEQAGRSHKGHVELRKTVMNLYGPGDN